MTNRRGRSSGGARVARRHIGNGARAVPLATIQLARLRGVHLTRWGEQGVPAGELHAGALIAIGTRQLLGLPEERRRRLAGLIAEGAVLYVRGLPWPGAMLDLAPFASVRAPLADERRAVAYRFTAHPMVPAALANEEVAGVFEAPGAALAGVPAQPLLTVRHVDGGESAAIFALQCGRGCVIYDLHPGDEACAESEGAPPLLAQLAHPGTRHRAVGALIAVERAAGRGGAKPSAFNLVIDDRPANFDHFNIAPLRGLLDHIETLCPGAHTDFAWTPSYTHPARSYIETLRKFGAGFVWHGLYHHVDHRTIADLGVDLAHGRRLAARIERRFDVRLQPVMIFPYERSTPTQLEFLRGAGFMASVEEPRPADSSPHGACLQVARVHPAAHGGPSGLVVLHRYLPSALTRDRMLAMAALGEPIIAYAHPWDVRLRRLSRFRPRGGDVSYFDQVLRFAAAKGLRARSLEEIAAEAGASRSQRAPAARAASAEAPRAEGVDG